MRSDGNIFGISQNFWNRILGNIVDFLEQAVRFALRHLHIMALLFTSFFKKEK